MPKPINGELDDEAVHLRQRGLYVEPLNYPFDKSQCPTNGHEYIHLVRLERAELYPEIASDFVVIPDKSDKPSKCPPKQDLKAWKKYKAGRFSDISARIWSDREQLMKRFRKEKELPPLEDEKDWCIYCLGSDLYKEIYDDEEVGHADGHLPYLSVVLHLEQEEVLRLLRNLSGWSCVVGMNHAVGRWIYALLAVLRKPVSDECESFLEEFYDVCALKAKVSDESEKYQFHLISTILFRHFCVKAYKLGLSMERIENASLGGHIPT